MVGLSRSTPERLTDVARDEALALSDEARTRHHDLAAHLFATRTPNYPFCPPGEAVVTLSNAHKILSVYCSAVLKQTKSQEQLCDIVKEETRRSPQKYRKNLSSIRYPTPGDECEVAKDEDDEDFDGNLSGVRQRDDVVYWYLIQ
jgi:hypothetical protein